MNRKVIRIILICTIIATIIVGGFLVYFFANKGDIVGRIDFGTKYYLSEIRETERFAGATANPTSYFEIKHDQKTGNLYLAGLTATNKAIPFIVTSYKEGTKETTIQFEYILNQGDDTIIERLTAVSTKDCIYIKSKERHGIQDVITQNPSDIKELTYEVIILIFNKEVTK